MSAASVKELFGELEADRWRVEHPFTSDIPEANALLHNPKAYPDEISNLLREWCQMRQPCQFGRIAATENRIHFCPLSEDALTTWTDAEIQEYTSEQKLLWKRRAVSDAQVAAHSFVLVAVAPKIAIAAPDRRLKTFSDRLLELSGWGPNRTGARRTNPITSDYLYLRDPKTGEYYGFKFNIDFFACAGDRRWWHDHRFPGGIAFTANSTGHMRFFREWYGDEKNGKEWTITQAMKTIQKAARTALPEISNAPDRSNEGRVTWLRNLVAGKPFVANTPCPLEQMPRTLQDKDWTRYEGLLHTDHSVREEFFLERDTPPTAASPYLMDFTYLYDEPQEDFKNFTAGKHFTEEEVYAEIGRPETWGHRKSMPLPVRTADDATQIASQMAVCSKWTFPSWDAE